jgi:hypothetical protein
MAPPPLGLSATFRPISSERSSWPPRAFVCRLMTVHDLSAELWSTRALLYANKEWPNALCALPYGALRIGGIRENLNGPYR